jgi:hypothetical protein
VDALYKAGAWSGVLARVHARPRTSHAAALRRCRVNVAPYVGHTLSARQRGPPFVACVPARPPGTRLRIESAEPSPDVPSSSGSLASVSSLERSPPKGADNPAG